MSTNGTIDQVFDNMNNSVEGLLESAETKFNEFSQQHPQIVATARAVGLCALAIISAVISPIWAGIGFGAGFIFHKDIDWMKKKLFDFYNDRKGLEKVVILTVGALLPLIAPTGFGVVAGAFTGSKAREIIAKVKIS